MGVAGISEGISEGIQSHLGNVCQLQGKKRTIAKGTCHRRVHRWNTPGLATAERDLINDLYRRGELTDDARRRIERELDLRDAHLSSVRAED